MRFTVSLFLPVVALRKESVDRNVTGKNLINGVCVALRKESVDRNAEAIKPS